MLIEFWKYRDLFFILVWRDILVRYKQTLFGILWAIVRPLISIIIFAFVFQKIANMPTHGDYPYQLTIFCAMLPWILFSHFLSEGGNSLLANTNLVTKVYFPRVFLPLSCIGVGFLDYFINIFVFICLAVFMGFHVNFMSVIGLIIASIPVLILSFGPVLYISAATAKYRDFRFMIPFVLQVGIYITPVGYELAALGPNAAQYLLYNPLTFCVEFSRYMVLGNYPMPGLSAFTSFIVFALISLVGGFRYFKRTSEIMADYI